MLFEKKLHFFGSSNWERKNRLKLYFFQSHNINVALLWLIQKQYTILEDFFLLDSVRYHGDVMTMLKSDWSNLKIPMSGWYRKLASPCVSFTIYQQCHNDIEGDVTRTSLQYHNVHWVIKRRTSSQLCPYELCEYFRAGDFTAHIRMTPSGRFFSLIGNSRTQITLFSRTFKARFWCHSNTT